MSAGSGVKFDQGKAPRHRLDADFLDALAHAMPADPAERAKIRLDLIPPEALIEAAKVLGFGAAKYGSRNWELGMDWNRPYDAAGRHSDDFFLRGIDNDKETGLLHVSHALTNYLFLTTYVVRGVGTDNRATTLMAAVANDDDPQEVMRRALEEGERRAAERAA